MTTPRSLTVVAALAICAIGLTGCVTKHIYTDEYADYTPPPPPQPTKVVVVKGAPPAHAPAHGHRKCQYDYYPTMQVYRDCHSRAWFWCEAGRWTSGMVLPTHIRVSHERSVFVELDTPTPYSHHEVVLRRHPAPAKRAALRDRHDHPGWHDDSTPVADRDAPNQFYPKDHSDGPAEEKHDDKPKEKGKDKDKDKDKGKGNGKSKGKKDKEKDKDKSNDD